MNLVLISTCTNRKTSKDLEILKASDLPEGNQKSVLSSWMKVLSKKRGKLPVKKIYSSRSSAIMRSLEDELQASLFFISAGLGFVNSNEIKPNYDLTIAKNGINSIIQKVTIGEFDQNQWWQGINPTNPHPISTFVRNNPHATIVFAITSTYFALIRNDIEKIAEGDLKRVRLIGIKPESEYRLLSTVVPYDSRFNGPDSPIPGTLSDFPQRCAAHFVRSVLPITGIGKDIKFVKAYMKSLRPQTRVIRERSNDDKIIKAMQTRLKQGIISNAGMLRHLRHDLHLACEQKRCANLYKIAKRIITNGRQKEN